MIGIGIALVCIVVMADLVSPKPIVHETKSVETTAWEEPQTAPVWQNECKVYRVAGKVPPVEWQEYLYRQLEARGIGWWMPYAVCQIQQESNWNQWSTNGHDHGLTQQKGVYWADRAYNAGWAGADIWDPYAQLYVYAWLMGQYLAATGYSPEGALSLYYLGYPGYSEEYIGHVMRWMSGLEEE